MKTSVSLPEVDLRYEEDFARRNGLPGRSAAFREAIAALRERELVDAYIEADAEWYGSGEASAWDAVSGDGIGGDQ